MARTTDSSPTYVQCRAGLVALIDGDQKAARYGDIYRADDPLVRAHRECFVELGELPQAHPLPISSS